MAKIPYDVYESPHEIVLIIPMGGVDKQSISITVRHETIFITGERTIPLLREDFEAIQTTCFRGKIELAIDLPPTSNYKDMISNLSKENILSVIIPKNLIPDHINILIESDDES